jgi:hypothetical protein
LQANGHNWAAGVITMGGGTLSLLWTGKSRNPNA